MFRGVQAAIAWGLCLARGLLALLGEMKADDYIYLSEAWFRIDCALSGCEWSLKQGLDDPTRFDYDLYGVRIRYFG